MPTAISLDDLRRYAVARTLFAPTTLARAIGRLGFVQADPIRAPARAQDLTLRHRVAGYRAGDLERRYPKLAIEEDFLVNYGFLPRTHLALLHPREAQRRWDAATRRRAADVLAFVRERGHGHPAQVHAAFDHGRATNYWGGSSNASTQLLDGMHYRGLLRVARREGGTRVYAAVAHEPDPRSPQDKAAALLDLVLAKYAPLPTRSLGHLVYLLGGGAPQLQHELKETLARRRRDLPSTVIDGTTWLWPTGDNPASRRWTTALDAAAERGPVRLLAPFDPIVWDRPRFEQLWGWAYRFEAYTPAPKRKLGYYALPLLWRDQVIGWGNLSTQAGRLQASFGYTSGRAPRDATFRRDLDAELERMRQFLGVLD